MAQHMSRVAQPAQPPHPHKFVVRARRVHASVR